MEPPRAVDMGHDLRNLVGLLRALSTDLGVCLDGSADELREIASDLDRHTRFAMDALRVIEKLSERSRVEISLGAWAWALRLWRRNLDLGDLSQSPNVGLVVPDAIEAGVALVDALSVNRRVSVEATALGISFRASTLASEPQLSAAIEAMRALGGLRVSRTEGPSSVLHVSVEKT